MKELSRSNLQYVQAFAAAWDEDAIVQHAVGQLPWGHVVLLLGSLDTRGSRDWHAAATVEYGWFRNVMVNMTMNKSMERTGTAPLTFTRSLPVVDSELAQQTAKDPPAFE